MREFCHAFLLLCLALASAAQGASIQAEVRPLTQRPRSDAPLWVSIQLTSSTPGLREGVLEMEMVSSGSTQYRLKTQELALLGKLSQRFLLPGTLSVGGERELRLRFVEKGSRTDLGTHSLGAVGWSAHSYVIAVGKSPLRTGAEGQPLWVSLKLENLAPGFGGGALTTSPVYLEPEDFPIDPLGYCAFDVVMLDGSVFSQLREKSLTALGAWLAAGGSVLVTARDKMEPGHARTLVEWAARDAKADKLAVDPEGQLDAGKTGIAQFRAGLGRLVVATKVPDEKDALGQTGIAQKAAEAGLKPGLPARWTGSFSARQPGLFTFWLNNGPAKVYLDDELFIESVNQGGPSSGNMTLGAGSHRFRVEVTNDVRRPTLQFAAPNPVQRGMVQLRLEKPAPVVSTEGSKTARPWLSAATFLWKIDYDQSIAALEYQRPVRLETERLQDAVMFDNNLFEALMPDQIQTIPGMLLIAILVAFVIAVGPLDWWLLGRLRARRWTWLLFPAVAVTATILTVQAARHYMGSSAIARELIVTDLATDCQVVRETRCEVLLPSNSGEHESAFSRALAAPMAAGTARWNRGVFDDEELSGISFEGQFPANYRMRRGIKQWKPMVTQSTTIGPGEDRSGVKWSEFRLAAPRIRPEIESKMAEGSGCKVGYATTADLSASTERMLPVEALEWVLAPRGRGRDFGGLSHSPGRTRRWLDLIDLGNDDLNGPVLVFAWRMEDKQLHVWRWLYRP